MSVSIVTCPECKTLLLSDTMQCPTCHHVPNPNKAIDLSGAKTHSQVMGSSADEIPCPECSEMVRKELVRCWQCGAFLRQEIAETYQRMRENNPPTSVPRIRDVTALADSSQPVSASSLPISTSQLSSLLPSADGELPSLTDDDDFSLGPGVTAIAPGQVGNTTVAPALIDDDDSYSLNAPVAAPEPTTSESALLPDVPMDESEGTSQTRASSAEAVPHSEATAGDVLLDIAKQEESESESRRKQRSRRRPGGQGGKSGFIIFCPYGHQIEVQEKHRGQMGKCPRCKAAFIVPQAQLQEKSSDAESAKPAEAASTPVEPVGALSAGKFNRWMSDVRVHPLDPTKLKLKPGSLESTFDAMDIAFGLDGLLLIGLVKKGSMFSSAEKKKPEIREAVVNHLAAGKPLSELQVASQRLFAGDAVKQIQVVQPVAYAHESMFAGIPVFGNNRIAVRLPKPADSNDLFFASFWLSEFREFAKQMGEVFEIQNLGEEMGVPLNDQSAEYKCHYTDQVFQALINTDYHQADPNIKLVPVGRKCEGCGLTISEDGRKKEKLGGADGKGIAKAKCPKCQKKFGSITYFAVDTSSTAVAPQ